MGHCSEHAQENPRSSRDSSSTYRELGGFMGCLLKQNRVEAIAETDGEDHEQCVHPYQVARNIGLR